MLSRIKKFYKKYERIQDLKKKDQKAELLQFAGGDRILKYKRKIGDEYRVLQKEFTKVIESAAPSAPPKSAKTTKAPVIEHPVSVMRTRKRDEKKESKAAPAPPPPPPAPVSAPNKKQKKSSPKKVEPTPPPAPEEHDLVKAINSLKKDNLEGQKSQAAILKLLNGFVLQFQEQTKQIKALQTKIDKLNKNPPIKKSQ